MRAVRLFNLSLGHYLEVIGEVLLSLEDNGRMDIDNEAVVVGK
jgi:hypothetical protein